MVKKTFQVEGMHCASCAAVIGKKIGKLNGIEKCEVNYATEKANVNFDPKVIDLGKINEVLSKLGYSLVESGNKIERKESKYKMYFTVLFSFLVFGLMMVGMLFSMPMEMFNSFLFALATIFLFWIGKPYLYAVVRFMQFGVANMDTLVGIGTLTAYLYSSLFSGHDYFDVTIVVTGFITLGKYLETMSKKKTGDAISKLLALQAKTAWVERDGQTLEIATDQIRENEIILVKSGSKIAADGVILDGQSYVDESMVTGEPMPVLKKTGDKVIGGTINKSGSFHFKATQIGEKSMLSQIIRMVEEAAGSRAPIQSLADKISAVFVPSVLIVAVVALVGWLIVGNISAGLLAFVGVLVIACPCALGLATPTAIVTGVGRGASLGILIKNATALEKLHSIDMIAFDKTGTLTVGRPKVLSINILQKKWDKNKLLIVAASLEKRSSHPIATAIVEAANKLDMLEVKNFTETEGLGVSGELGKKIYFVGKNGSNNLVVLEEGIEVGTLEVGDQIKETAKKTILELKKIGVTPVMITGDNQMTAKNVAFELGIEQYHAGITPAQKSKIVEELQNQGHKVAFAGDGINDAVVLSKSDVGLAMATGTDVAIEAADITLMSGDIDKILTAIKLSKATFRTIKQNLFWAFAYNVVGIPLAALGMLNPVFAGLAMALSSVSVVGNSLLLKRFSTGKS